MLLSSLLPHEGKAQPVAKVAACQQCKSPVSYRTAPRRFCSSCLKERRREQMRLVAERRRRKNGIPKVKGTSKLCLRCSTPIELNRNAHTRHCQACAHEHALEKAREASRRKSQTAEGRAAASEWTKKKRARDPSFRVSSHMKVLIHRGLDGKKAGRSWREFVPYTLDQLMAHLERQFLPGMTWENKGEWHIDHIRPLSSFQFDSPADPAFQDAWALSNLRPLWGRDNIRKQAKRTHLI